MNKADLERRASPRTGPPLQLLADVIAYGEFILDRRYEPFRLVVIRRARRRVCSGYERRAEQPPQRFTRHGSEIEMSDDRHGHPPLNVEAPTAGAFPSPVHTIAHGKVSEGRRTNTSGKG